MPATPSRRRLPLAALAVLLLALCQPGPAAAAPWTSLWNWLAAWTGGGWISTFGRSDQGPDIDPNGQPTSATGRSDLGPDIDPLGRPTSGQGDLGPTIDPNGGGR